MTRTELLADMRNTVNALATCVAMDAVTKEELFFDAPKAIRGEAKGP